MNKLFLPSQNQINKPVTKTRYLLKASLASVHNDLLTTSVREAWQFAPELSVDQC